MSTLAVNSIVPANAGSEDYFLAKAWVNFNGTGTITIRGDGNVSSIGDLGTGNYDVNFSTALQDSNFSYSHAYSNEVNGQHGIGFLGGIYASKVWISHYNAANSAQPVDKSHVLITVFR